MILSGDTNLLHTNVLLREPGRVSVAAGDLADTLAELDRVTALAESRLNALTELRAERDLARRELERTRKHLSSALREATLD